MNLTFPPSFLEIEIIEIMSSKDKTLTNRNLIINRGVGKSKI